MGSRCPKQVARRTTNAIRRTDGLRTQKTRAPWSEGKSPGVRRTPDNGAIKTRCSQSTRRASASTIPLWSLLVPDPLKNLCLHDYYSILYYYYCLLYLYYLLIHSVSLILPLCLSCAIHDLVSTLFALSSGVGRHYTLRPAPSVSCHIILSILCLALTFCIPIITILSSFILNYPIFILLTSKLSVIN